MKYIDLHTHQIKNSKVLEVKNIFAQDFSENSTHNQFSIGLHPWHIENVDIELCLKNMEEASRNKNMLFIGECGLDRVISIDFKKQEECFIRQIKIAQITSKPLIIHCVRAFNDLIRLKKIMKPTNPWIIHGYYGNKDTTLSLIKYGFYFSVNDRLIFDKLKRENLKLIPLDFLFLETDESTFPIEFLYQKSSEVLSISLEELVSAINNNYRRILNKDLQMTECQ